MGYYMSIDDFSTPFFIAAILYFISTLVFWQYFKGGNDVRLAEIVKQQSHPDLNPVAGD